MKIYKWDKKEDMTIGLRFSIFVLLYIFSFSFFFVTKPGRGEGTTADIEIPVRVFKNGHPVSNLSKEDFKIYENNKLHSIKDFSIKSRKINTRNCSRYFVLVFKIVRFNEQLGQSLEYIFNNILGEQDRLMIRFANKILLFKNIGNKAKSYSIVEKMVRQQSQLMTKNQKMDFKKTGEFISYLRRDYERNVSNKLSHENQGKIYQHYYMVYFRSYLRRYINILLDYNKRYLIPDLDQYYLFARDIKDSAMEKWIINFYQVSQLPRLVRRNRAMIKKMIDDLANSESSNPEDEYDYEKKISKLLGSIDNALSVTAFFPSEEMTKLFNRLNATYSSIRIDNNKEFKENSTKDSRFKAISERIEIEETNIANSTGGSYIDLKEPGVTIESLTKKEDVYYLLTYTPENPHKPGKIRVEAGNNNYQLYYDDIMRTDYISGYIEKKGEQLKKIRIKNVTFKQKKLSFEISDFLMKESNKQTTGKLHVHIRIEDMHNKTIFDENKTMVSKKDSVYIVIGLKLKEKEPNDVTVKVTDLISGETYIEYSRI